MYVSVVLSADAVYRCAFADDCLTRGVARRRASLATGAVRWSRSRDSLAITPRDSLAYGSTVFKALVVQFAEVLAICLSLSNIVGQEMTVVR